MKFKEKINPVRIIEKIVLIIFWHKYLQKDPFFKAYKKVLELKSENPLLKNITIQEERALPSDPYFQKNGWWKKMILRYGIAANLSKNKKVLDTCSGLGWGSFLVSQKASIVTSIDIDHLSSRFAQKYWDSANINFQVASVLDMPFDDDSFDVVLAMESLEHFTQEDGYRYFNECFRVLKKGGVFFGSSVFPLSREEASDLCSNNPYHLYVYTRKELRDLLVENFQKVYIFKNRLFFLAKK